MLTRPRFSTRHTLPDARCGILLTFTATRRNCSANGACPRLAWSIYLLLLTTIAPDRFKRTGKRDDIFLASKFGIVALAGGRVVDGTPEYVRKAAEKSLRRLGVDCIDLYYLHVRDFVFV